MTMRGVVGAAMCAAVMMAAGRAMGQGAAGAATAPAAVPALTFDDKGAKVGERLPDVAVRSLDDEPMFLDDKMSSGLTLLVTSSYTCPKSRANFPALVEIAAKYKGKVNVVILYVIEAHPSGDPSPYRNGKEDVTPENQRDGILRRQPTTMDRRLTLANDFKNKLDVKIPIVVDGMENWGWKSMGAGPNMAILVRSGAVVARQGWFDGKTLPGLIDAALAVPVKGPAAMMGYVRASDQVLYKKLQEEKVVDWSITNLLEKEKVAGLPAVLKKYPELVTFVEEHMAKGDSGGETLLQAAAKANSVAGAAALLAAGADVDGVTPWRGSAVELAAEAGNDDVLKVLLGKSKQIKTAVGSRALQAALLRDHQSTAGLLRAAGAAETYFTRVAAGDVAAVKRELEKDVSLAGRPDREGRMPAEYAAATGQTAMVKLLTEAQPGLLRLTRGGDGAMEAVEHHHPPTLAALLAAGADANGSGGGWGSVLDLAVRQKDAEMVAMLLTAGAKVNVSDILGRSPLHNAAADGSVAIMRLLLAAGADVNAKSGEEMLPCGPPGPTAKEETPLQNAVESDNVEAVKLLLGAKVDLAAENVLGKTALEYAKSEGVRKLLMDAGAKPGSGKPHVPKAEGGGGLGMPGGPG